MAEDPRLPEPADAERATDDEPKLPNPPDVREETAEDMLEEDRFEATDN